MNNGKQPISPTMYTKFGDGADDYQPLKDGQKTGWEVKFGGLTKREYFAGLAMQGLIASFTEKASYGGWGTEMEATIKCAIDYADELLKQLEEK